MKRERRRKMQSSGRFMTLEEVGKVLGISKARVMQIEHAALRKLRGKLEAER